MMTSKQIDKVSTMLEEAIDNIFLTMQEEMGIKDGSLDFFTTNAINDKRDELVEKICYGLMWQKVFNKAGDDN